MSHWTKTVCFQVKPLIHLPWWISWWNGFFPAISETDFGWRGVTRCWPRPADWSCCTATAPCFWASFSTIPPWYYSRMCLPCWWAVWRNSTRITWRCWSNCRRPTRTWGCRRPTRTRGCRHPTRTRGCRRPTRTRGCRAKSSWHICCWWPVVWKKFTRRSTNWRARSAGNCCSMWRAMWPWPWAGSRGSRWMPLTRRRRGLFSGMSWLTAFTWPRCGFSLANRWLSTTRFDGSKGGDMLCCRCRVYRLVFFAA